MAFSLKTWEAVDGISSYDEKLNLVNIYTPHALSQLIGYIKFSFNKELIVYRGQRTDHNSIIPSLYRHVRHGKDKLKKSKNNSKQQDVKICSRKVKELDLIISEFENKNAFIQNTNRRYFEAIMQHYGFNTRYIDFVDNIWVALVFSILAFSKSPFRFSDDIVYFDENGYGYIYVLTLGEIIPETNDAIYTSKKYEIIDLRRQLPSLYLRPHSQHGLLAKKKFSKENQLATANSDMIKDVVAKIRIKKSTVMRWIGNSKILSPDFLFPPMALDKGYATLATVNTRDIFNNIIHGNSTKYKDEITMYDHFGCVKMYAYEQEKSDYSAYFSDKDSPHS
jgi:hypothetical protein